MNLHLYYCPGTCSFVPHVALELVKESSGQNFDGTVINLKNGEHLKPEYKAINPRGQVPALIVDGKLITQVMAITGFLHDSFPKAQIFRRKGVEFVEAEALKVNPTNQIVTTSKGDFPVR